MDFGKRFWLAFAVGAALCLMICQSVLFTLVGSRPSRPSFPDLRETYISSYRRGDNDHYLFQHGIFGFGTRLREADILIGGSSHPEFGLSASQLSKNLSRGAKKAVKVFNFASGFGEGSGYARLLIGKHDIRHKLLLFDLYADRPDQLSDAAVDAERESKIVAYRLVASNTVDFLLDWIFDAVAPRLHPPRWPSTTWMWKRALESTVLRTIAHGDVVDYWTPAEGSRFAHPAPNLTFPIAVKPSPGLLLLPSSLLALLQARDINAVAMQVPSSFTRTSEAERLSNAARIPFVQISPAGLQTFDGDHLIAESRQMATAEVCAKVLVMVPGAIK
jgi:hypothetical protein